MANQGVQRHHPSSHLFTVRVWIEGSDPIAQEARIQVLHVLSGETRFFRDWRQLTAYLQAKLAAVDDAAGDSAAH